MKSKLIATAVFLILGSAAVGILELKTSGTKAGKLTVVRKADLVETVAGIGSIQSSSAVKISTGVEGVINELRVSEGAEVSQGDMLFEVRNDRVDVELSMARANVAAAREAMDKLKVGPNKEETLVVYTNLAKAQQAYEQLKRDGADKSVLFERGFASKNAVDEAQWKLKIAESDLEVAQTAADRVAKGPSKAELQLSEARLKEAEDALLLVERRDSARKVPAPIGGTVTRVALQEDSLGREVPAGTEVLTVSDMSKLVVKARLLESDVNKVSSGQAVRIFTREVSAREFSGRVDSVSFAAESAGGVPRFPVTISLEGGDLPLKPGISVDFRITVSRAENALLIPVEFVHFESAQAYATVVSRGRPEERGLSLGISDGTCFEVLAGLEEGETVSVPVVR